MLCRLETHRCDPCNVESCVLADIMMMQWHSTSFNGVLVRAVVALSACSREIQDMCTDVIVYI